MNKQKLQIFILCRDRVNFLNDVLTSAKLQKSDLVDIEIIISDNSVNNDVELFCKENFPEIKYIRRNPPTDVDTHFKILHQEITGDLVVFFHDDDIFHPKYASRMVEAFKEHKNASAVSCNGYIKKELNNNLKIRCANFESTIIFNNEKSFFRRYFEGNGGACPFPAYMYRKESLNPSHINKKDGGKYFDVSFLANKISTGAIVWIPEPLITYRIHDSNDSRTYSVSDMRSLRLYMEKNFFNKNDPEMINQKISSWYVWMSEKGLMKPFPHMIVPPSFKHYIIYSSILKNKLIKKSYSFIFRLSIGILLFRFKHALRNVC